MRINRRSLSIFGVFLVAAAILLHIFLGSIYRLPVLMYHSIGYAADRNNKIIVSPDAFSRQMEYLHDNGYNVIPLEKAVRYIENRKRPPAKTLAITFDDGYADNYKYAYPVLKRFNIPATIFVIADLVGKDGFMNWDELKEVSSSGVIDIESHTLSHPFLTGLDDGSLKRELEGSKKILGDMLGKRIRFLCYPMGLYDERVKSAARAAGYRAAFATKPTRLAPNHDIYEIKRVRISPTADNLFVFAVKISGYHAFFRIVQNDYKDMPSIIWQKKY